ncbi:MAG: DUF481 domain-containing protein [Deltaproteobacteria bacterium]|nr:DUF481 domain-containing protein [Deltaproteobacteria bacterium]
MKNLHIIFSVVFCLVTLFALSVFAQGTKSEPVFDVDKVDTNIVDDVKISNPSAAISSSNTNFGNWYYHSPYFYSDVINKWKVHNDTKIGFMLTSGNTRSYTFSAAEEFGFSRGPLVNTLTGGASYAQSSTVPNTPLAEDIRFIFASDKFEWHFKNKFYAFVEGGWYSDKPSGYESNYHGLGGLGYFFVDRENVVFRVESAYYYNFEDLVSPQTSQSLHSIWGGFRFYWKIQEWTSWENTLFGIENVMTPEDFRLKLQSNLKFKVVKHFYFGIGLDMRYDSQPVVGLKKTDSNISGVMGFRF